MASPYQIIAFRYLPPFPVSIPIFEHGYRHLTQYQAARCLAPHQPVRPAHAAQQQVANIPDSEPVAKGLHAFQTGLSAMARSARLILSRRECWSPDKMEQNAEGRPLSDESPFQTVQPE